MSTQGVPEGHHTVTPYLIVKGVGELLDFVSRAFGAEELMRTHGPDGSIAHAEARIGDSRIMTGEARDEWPAMPALLHLYVADADAVYRRAMEAGATSVQEPRDQIYGDRSGGVRDAFGNLWWIATRVENLSVEEIERRGRQQDASGG